MNANSKPLAQTIEQWLRHATTALAGAGIPSARLDTELILAHVLNKDRTWLISHSDELLDESEQADRLIERRIERIPLAYLTGHKEFYGRDFIVTPDVLIPRPESEMIIHILRELPLVESPNIHDVGTGSGNLAISIALELPTSFVSGSDVSLEAIKIARKNAEALGASNTQFRTDNLMANHNGPYDVITANLPYVNPEWQRSPETDHEPSLALFADDNGVALIKQLITRAEKTLRSGGYLLLESDPEQHETLVEWGGAHSLGHVRTDDYIVTLER